MLFSLPWDVRARIWARARFLAARDGLAAHLPDRAGRQRLRWVVDPHVCAGWGAGPPWMVEARLRISEHRMMTVTRATVSWLPFDELFTVTRDLETVRVHLVSVSGFPDWRIVTGAVEERWLFCEEHGWRRSARA